MLRSLKLMLGSALGATDGTFGHVKDFYFDDRHWAVRYVVADTGSWLTGRKVLLSPHAIAKLPDIGQVLNVRLTKKQIEASPSIESHLPVSRQYEQEYHAYYGWPFYWQGEALWGMNSFPLLELPTSPPTQETKGAPPPATAGAAAHLRSTQAVTGYHLRTHEGLMGHVSDFLMNQDSWQIEQLVIKIGHRFSGKEVPLPTSAVERVSYEESTIFAIGPKDTSGQSEPQALPPAITAG